MKRPKASRLTSSGSFVLFIVAVFSAGCNRHAPAAKDNDAQNKEAPTQPAATTTAPIRMTFSHKIEGPGEIQADEQTRIFAKITGFVNKVNKDIGDFVEPGDVLAELSVPELDEELLEKEARVTQAKAELERAKKLHDVASTNVQYADAKVKEAVASRPRAVAELARAESTYERMKKSASVIADEAIAETKLGFESSKAAVAEADAKIKSAEALHGKSVAEKETAYADIAVADARLRVSEAAARNMKETMKYAKLTAPYAGVVIKRHVDLGDLVKSSASSSKEEALYVVARMNPVRIFVDVPENDAAFIKNGKDDQQKAMVTVRVQALKGELFKGVVKRSAWALDPTSRILPTQIDLPNPDGKLRPGMYAYAIITVIRENVWAVPAAAVVTKDEQSHLFLEVNGKAQRTAILVGLRDPKFIEVIKKQKHGPEGGWQDFAADDKIIATNVASLVDGQALDASRPK